MDWRAGDYTRRPIKSAGVRFSINENANHFFPKSLRDAPMWYTLSSTIRKRSWDLVNTFTEMAGYCISIRLRRTKFQRRQPIANCDNLCGFPHNYFLLGHSSNIFAKITILAQTLQKKYWIWSSIRPWRNRPKTLLVIHNDGKIDSRTCTCNYLYYICSIGSFRQDTQAVQNRPWSLVLYVQEHGANARSAWLGEGQDDVETVQSRESRQL